MKPAVTRAKLTGRWVEIEVDEVRLHCGEFVTVLLFPGDSDQYIQVELHVTAEGKPHIFCDEIGKTQNFSEYNYGEEVRDEENTGH